MSVNDSKAWMEWLVIRCVTGSSLTSLFMSASNKDDAVHRFCWQNENRLLPLPDWIPLIPSLLLLRRLPALSSMQENSHKNTQRCLHPMASGWEENPTTLQSEKRQKHVQRQVLYTIGIICQVSFIGPLPQLWGWGFGHCSTLIGSRTLFKHIHYS